MQGESVVIVINLFLDDAKQFFIKFDQCINLFLVVLVLLLLLAYLIHHLLDFLLQFSVLEP